MNLVIAQGIHVEYNKKELAGTEFFYGRDR